VAHHQKRSLVVAALSGLASLVGGYVAYLYLGVATGAIAICAWAPRWWVGVYFTLALALPGLCVWLAVKSRRWYLRRHEGAGA
jgi:hypothetical protein